MTASVNLPVILLAIGAALSLTIVEVIYVLKRIISPVYLADAFVELMLIVWWAVNLWIG